MTNIERDKSTFIDICKNNITREGIDKLMQYLEETDFYTAPASTKYHGSYPGGLLAHSLNVYYELQNYIRYIYGTNTCPWSNETLAIVSLFHDLCKINRYIITTKNVKDPTTGQWEKQNVYAYNTDYISMGHGSKSLAIILSHISLTEEEQNAIYWHMGAYDLGNYNTVADLSNSFTKNSLAFALHMADMTTTYVTENDKFN